ncbi:hypothetical protein SAMN05192554_11954 [Haloarchaeobius iranensis]|uniref:Uncharacterized protein n=1 Tax=Haloarchaeobius iranensis TaxID=996166 RepID=A0A1G9ZD41_9EURY|nr:hypothetical protein SAMN05192554_11954 [Haloarchaeobius iranensis]
MNGMNGVVGSVCSLGVFDSRHERNSHLELGPFEKWPVNAQNGNEHRTPFVAAYECLNGRTHTENTATETQQ